jgi:hypothetical protein
MGEVAQRYREHQQAQQRAFPDAAALVRHRWRRLRARMRVPREDR